MDYDDSLLDDFVAESREHLDAIEPDLLEMEKDGSNASSEVLNRVFRAIHSIKGASGFFAFESLKKLSHTMENVLMPVRDGELDITPEMMDVLLASVDKLRTMIDDVHASDDVPCEDEITKLGAFLGKGDEVSLAPDEDQAVSAETDNDVEFKVKVDLQTDSVRSALKHGKKLYEIVVNLRHDLYNRELTPEQFTETVESVGDCLAIPDGMETLEKRIEEDVSFSFLFATVLEEDLVRSALGLSSEKIKVVDIDEVKKQLQGDQTGNNADQAGSSDQPDSGQEAPTAASEDNLIRPIGELLVSLGVSSSHIAWALQKQSSGDKTMLGQILLKKGFITSEQLAESLKIQEGQLKEAKKAVSKSSSESKPKGKTSTETTETLRVRVPLLTRLMNTAGELVLGRNQLFSALDKHTENVPGLAAILQNLDHVTTELQEGIMQTRMQPIGAVFGRFSRVVRDISRQLGKEIDLETEGSEVELDKSIIELLSDPLTHIVRNCADHAIETPDERQQAGKRRKGRILLRAAHEGGQVNISVSDDGRGIDTDRVLAKAVEKSIVTQAEADKMSQNDIVKLIFAPGFSTAQVVTEVSGRGVGMDVVRTNIEKLGGHIDVETAAGEGTTVSLQLPLTLAIIPALVIGDEGFRFAVPQVNMVELVWIRADEVRDRIESVNGANVLRLRGALLPLVRLADVLGIPKTYIPDGDDKKNSSQRERLPDRRSPRDEQCGSSSLVTPIVAAKNSQLVDRDDQDRRKDWHSDYNILVLKVGANQFGVIVDDLFDTEEIVVKPLSSFLKECTCFAGSTIMGDGRVIMILDAGGLARQANLRFSDVKKEEDRRQAVKADMQADVASSRSVILFRNAEDELFAVGQDNILRLERIYTADIERIGNKEFIQYRGSPLPLVRLDSCLPVKPLATDLERMYMVIPRDVGSDNSQDARGGILASDIVDALNVNVRIQQSSITGPGVEGSAIVNGKLTLFIDPVAVLDAACEACESRQAA